MYILGINAYHADSSACLIKDGKIVLAIEEERLRREKHWAGFPIMAIKACLTEAGINITDVDHITISKDPSANLLKKLRHTLFTQKKFLSVLDRIKHASKVKSVKSILAEEFGIPENEIKAEVHNIEHHRSHLASTFFASPFEEAALLSIDGFGDFTSTMLAVGKGNNIEVLEAVYYPHSLGTFYTAITQFLGFPNYGDEYKVMGLSSYGEPKYLDLMRDIVILKENGLFELNLKYFSYPTEGVSMSWEEGKPFIDRLFSDYLIEKLGQPRKKGEEITDYHKDLAASAQRMAELTIFHILNHLYEKTGLTNLCIAGGVAQNSVANGKIYQNTKFEKIYIPSAATDAGTSVGSALYLYNQILKQPRIKPVFHANLGQKFDDEAIKQALEEKNLEDKRLTDEEINELVANALMEGKIIGWFKDRTEFGPRALGYRSILANPTMANTRDILNLKIKRREPFRPFAPSILEEYTDEYFEFSEPVPFMEKVYVIRPEKRKEIPAVTHVDGTGRLQTVSRDVNPKYYAMIEAFYKKSGVPIVLNTSFNENEPIVNTPEDAINTFLRTKMDVLVLENYVVER